MAALTFIQLQQICANLLGTPLADFTENGENQMAIAINNAKRTAEREYDFTYCQVNALLSVSSMGSSIQGATLPNTLSVSGTSSGGDFDGNFVVVGMLNSQTLYQSGSGYIFWNGGAWILAATTGSPTDYYQQSPITSGNPTGSYDGQGAYNGHTAIVVIAMAELKRIDNVLLPISGGAYVPIEFLTQETWQERIRQQLGRQVYDPTQSLASLGFYIANPVAVQQGQMIYVYPSTGAAITYPISALLDSVQFMPDYVNDYDTDWFLEFAPEYLQWQAIIEGNKLSQTFVQRREGNLDETNLEAEAAQAFQSLIEWDQSISRTTGTPDSYRQSVPQGRQPKQSSSVK